MASSAPISRLSTHDTLLRYVKIALGGLTTALVGGLIGALLSYHFTAKLNNESALQQQYLLAVQDFNATGAKLDSSVTELTDTVVDEEGLKDARKEARQAIAAHVAAVQGLSIVLGERNVDNYMFGVARLREYVDAANTPQQALIASKARFALMENRNMLLQEARRRIYHQK